MNPQCALCNVVLCADAGFMTPSNVIQHLASKPSNTCQRIYSRLNKLLTCEVVVNIQEEAYCSGIKALSAKQARNQRGAIGQLSPRNFHKRMYWLGAATKVTSFPSPKISGGCGPGAKHMKPLKLIRAFRDKASQSRHAMKRSDAMKSQRLILPEVSTTKTGII